MHLNPPERGYVNALPHGDSQKCDTVWISGRQTHLGEFSPFHACPASVILAMASKTPTRIAFISGPLDVDDEYFEKYYRPKIDAAIDSGDSFVVGSVAGIDTLALQYLLKRQVSASRIGVYMACFEIDCRRDYVAKLRKEVGAEIVVEARREDGTDSITTWDRDAAMTRASDYDILRFRTELESKHLYGKRWRPMVSNTERNMRRRTGQDVEECRVEYVRHVDPSQRRPSGLDFDSQDGVRVCEQCNGH